jgi:hypothetical protein
LYKKKVAKELREYAAAARKKDADAKVAKRNAKKKHLVTTTPQNLMMIALLRSCAASFL